MELLISHFAPGGSGTPPTLMCLVVIDTTSSVLHLRGELDAETSALLARLVAAQIERGDLDVSLDLEGVVFCDLQGLYSLRAARRDLQAAGGRMRVLRPRPFLLQVASLCGLQDLFGALPDKVAAQ